MNSGDKSVRKPSKPKWNMSATAATSAKSTPTRSAPSRRASRPTNPKQATKLSPQPSNNPQARGQASLVASSNDLIRGDKTRISSLGQGSSGARAEHTIEALRTLSSDRIEDTSDSSEMATSSLKQDELFSGGNLTEQETNIDSDIVNTLDDATDDDESATLLGSSPSSDNSNAQDKPSQEDSSRAGNSVQYQQKTAPYTTKRYQTSANHNFEKESLLICNDDEEINQITIKSSSEDDEFHDPGSIMTLVDDPSLTEPITFVVYPVGCCEFDETQLVSASSTKAIQRCILRLLNASDIQETSCWGLSQNEPILMRLQDRHIQFIDLERQTLLRDQPILTLRTWAVDDDNNFAFVVEDSRTANPSLSVSEGHDLYDSVEFALLNEPAYTCYVFRSFDDDDMSCRVAAMLNDEIGRYKYQAPDVDRAPELQPASVPTNAGEPTDADNDPLGELEDTNEVILQAKYLGGVRVPRPMGVDVLNIAIDTCLSETCQKHSIDPSSPSDLIRHVTSLIDARIHVSPSSVIVENVSTGEIIVECRIRFLTFMGISRRDIRWCGFIMQNTTNKTFIAHCFECRPTAGPVCDAIQASCAKMYENMLKNQKKNADATSIIPQSSKIRDTLAKTLSRIRLNPII